VTGLEQKAHRLVELARDGDEPSAAQLAQLHGAVVARIAAEGALSASGTTAAGKVTSAAAVLKGALATAAIVTGAVGFWALRGGEPPVPPAPLVRPVATPGAASAVAPTKSPEVAAPPPVPSAEAPAPPLRAAKPASGLRLQEEAALLAEVQGALRSGHASAALGKLESYDRRFPGGMLRAEADAARVFALCAAGQVDRARASAARFAQRYPSSPAAARVQAACR